MAMTISSGDGDPMVDMNTTPLIDVMLVLLIMFIITLPVMTNNTRIDLPTGKTNNPPAGEAINLSIEYDGTMVWNGNVVANVQQLEQYLRSAASQPVQPELHVRPDKRAKYDDVAQVLAIAQRNGIQRIGFAGQEQYAN